MEYTHRPLHQIPRTVLDPFCLPNDPLSSGTDSARCWKYDMLENPMLQICWLHTHDANLPFHHKGGDQRCSFGLRSGGYARHLSTMKPV